jgi:hypothetical protein
MTPGLPDTVIVLSARMGGRQQEGPEARPRLEEPTGRGRFGGRSETEPRPTVAGAIG